MSNERLSEEDVKRIYITPAITNAGWRDIRMEYFTDGRVHVASNGVMTRGKRKYADYLLRYPSNINLAIVEAKDENHTPGQGLLQAVEYARLLNVPFAYSSNGHGFVEHDLITAVERELTMAEFPSPEVLRERYIKEKALTKEQLDVIEYPFHIAQDFKPRYYQKASVDKTLEAIAKGNRRCLVVLATGTGKTYTAFQIVWKLKQMRKIKKVLYLADRNILINKPYREEFAPFGDSRTIISKGKIDTSHEIYFGLYQQLDNEKGISNLEAYKQVSPEFFDLIIVDECHRGSAKEDSNWREILDYFHSAIQIGMTATPKVYLKQSDNNDEREIDLARTYFGEPVYTYSLRQGIDDGFLAPYKVMRKFLDIDVKKYRPYKGELDIHGNLLEDREYDERDFDRKLIVDSRTHEVAEQITKFLKETDRFQKTIVFCCNINHAERLRQELWNLNLDICRVNHRYITRITGDSPTGKEDLDDFTKIEFNKDLDPCIVVSSDLMTTGVDCKTTKLIVIDKIINSVTLFKQIIGRGTRLRIADNKYEFLIMDFRRASELFTDHNWDGPVEYVDSITPTGRQGHSPLPTDNIVYHINGEKVTIMGEDVSILDADGKLTRQSLINYTRTNILNEYATLDDFIQTWSSAKKHKIIVEELATHGVLLEQIRAELGITDMDDFDLICHIAYGMKPITRSERVKHIRKSKLLDKYTGIARDVIDRLLEKYCDEGVEDVDDIAILKLDEFKEFGTPKYIINNIFGGRENYISAVTIIKNNLYGGNAA
jgi:type I restriction enzyme R subunit